MHVLQSPGPANPVHGGSGVMPNPLFHYIQHFLYFFPLPQEQGSFLPIFGPSCAIVMLSGFPIRGRELKAFGFNIYSTSDISSGSSGSYPPINIHPFWSHKDAICCNLSSVCTLNLTGGNGEKRNCQSVGRALLGRIVWAKETLAIEMNQM